LAGIHANNTFPPNHQHNLVIETNSSPPLKTGGKKLLFLGSSFIYPKFRTPAHE
jgi:hypothetical protein